MGMGVDQKYAPITSLLGVVIILSSYLELRSWAGARITVQQLQQTPRSLEELCSNNLVLALYVVRFEEPSTRHNRRRREKESMALMLSLLMH